MNGHVLRKLLVRESQGCQNFKTARRHAAFVCRSILEDNGARLFETESRFLSEKEIRAFNNVFETRVSVGCEELPVVGKIDRLGATTAGNEKVGSTKRIEVELKATTSETAGSPYALHRRNPPHYEI